MTASLIATSHGTGVPAARTAITALVDAVCEAAPHLDVREAFVDVQQPRVAQVVGAAVGPSVVVPLLLAPGFHVNVDIRRVVASPAAVAARTLGPDSRLTAMLVDRLVDSGASADDVVVLGAAGSTDARALRSVEAMARMLGVAWRAPVPVGYVGGAGPPIEKVVHEVDGAGRRVVVASYLVAPGFFHGRLAEAGADVVTRPLLDGATVSPDLVSLVLDRFEEAAARLPTPASGASSGF